MLEKLSNFTVRTVSAAWKKSQALLRHSFFQFCHSTVYDAYPPVTLQSPFNLLLAYRNAFPQVGKADDIEERHYLYNKSVFHGHVPRIGVVIRFVVFGCGRSIS